MALTRDVRRFLLATILGLGGAATPASCGTIPQSKLIERVRAGTRLLSGRTADQA